MIEALGCDDDLFLSPPLLVRKLNILFDFSVFGDVQRKFAFTETFDPCLSPSSSVFSLSLNFS